MRLDGHAVVLLRFVTFARRKSSRICASAKLSLTTLNTMTNMRYVLLTAVCLFAMALGTHAQKIAFVNSNAILEGMAEVKAAESDIVAFSTQKQKLLEDKMKAAQAEYTTLAEKQQAGELTPKQLQEGEASLQLKQQELQKMEADMQQELIERREMKFQPIFDRVNTAIAAVAQEESYTYVFDANASGVIVYADESMNITDKVQAKLAAN